MKGQTLPKAAFLSVAPPTPNGNLHLGHLAGPYVASDVYRRYLRLRGVPVVLVSGSDDNQSYVAVKGRKMDLAPAAVAARFGDAVHATLEKVGVCFDYFLRPNQTPEYVTFVQDFFRKLVDSGRVQSKEVDGYYCDFCRRHLFEAYAGGECPHCQAETNAQGCEDCGFYSEAIDLRKPECNLCLRVPSTRRIRKFFFALEPHRDRLADFLSQAEIPAHLRAFTTRLLSRPLPEVSASFLADWGIPVPIAGYEGQVIYEWLEMAAGYLFMAKQLEARTGGHAFDGRNDVEITQFFGFDNGFFYTTFIPALLLADNEGTRLPNAFPSNRYLQLDGLKFSTSTAHAVWGDELLEVIPSDIVRFCLMQDRPENEHANFTVAACRDRVASELAGRWEAWLRSLSERVSRFPRDFLEPAPQDPAHAAFRESLIRLKEAMERHYGASHFSMNQAARTLCDLVGLAREFSESEKTSLALELMAAKTLAVLAAPILPDFSRSLWRALGEESELTWEGAVTLPSGPIRTPLIDNGFSLAAEALGRFEEDYRGKRNQN